MAVADVNGDGKPDLIVATALNRAGLVGVLIGNGDGTFQVGGDLQLGWAYPACGGGRKFGKWSP